MIIHTIVKRVPFLRTYCDRVFHNVWAFAINPNLRRRALTLYGEQLQDIEGVPLITLVSEEDQGEDDERHHDNDVENIASPTVAPTATTTPGRRTKPLP